MVLLLLLLTGGAIINVAVAWGNVCLHNWRLRTDSYELFVRSSRAPSTIMSVGRAYQSIYQSGPGVMNNWSFGRRVEFVKEEQYQSLVPHWSTFYRTEPTLQPITIEGAVGVSGFSEQACGWPLYSLRGSSTWLDTSGYQFSITKLDCQIKIAAPSFFKSRRPIHLPYQPLWPGFAINTIFYAGLLWALFFAAGKIRRFIVVRGRIKRHRCPACAYPVGTSPVCTECGHPLGKAL